MNYQPKKMMHYRLKTMQKNDEYPSSNTLLTAICAVSSLLTLIALLLTLSKK